MTIRDADGRERHATVVPLTWAVLGTLAILFLQAAGAGVLYGSMRAEIGGMKEALVSIESGQHKTADRLMQVTERLARMEGEQYRPGR